MSVGDNFFDACAYATHVFKDANTTSEVHRSYTCYKYTQSFDTAISPSYPGIPIRVFQSLENGSDTQNQIAPVSASLAGLAQKL